MPQLVPFYFVNQVTFTFVILIIMIYLFSKNVLPKFVRLFLTRIFISKL
jgi:F-type H+-transporting ATPase subunit 8